MKSLLKKKGFTLVEVLIVVVILGILAALILPRMLAQPERAITAEANQYLGVIRRAQINLSDTTAAPGTANYIDAASGPGGGPIGAGWSSLGLSALPLTTAYTYACVTGSTGVPVAAPTPASAGSCTATRLGTGTKGGGTITIDIESGSFGCGSPYVKTTGAVVCS